MREILNITNGDSPVSTMKAAGVVGEILPWRDVLHEGPVPYGYSLEELSKLRAEFIVQQGWGTAERTKQGFQERDTKLKSFKNYSQVKLWFEHDLYDQLQILQILDYLSDQQLDDVPLSMICTDQYLGRLDTEQMRALKSFEKPVSEEVLTLARAAWRAFRSSTPEVWNDLLKADTGALPFLQPAVLRWLKEFPDRQHGLSWTAYQVLDIVSQREEFPGKVFRQYQEREDAQFMGDWSFYAVLKDLLDCDPALIKLNAGERLIWPPNGEQELSITPKGLEVLNGDVNALDVLKVNRWMGGVRLTPENMWCWNSILHKIEQR